MAETEIEPEEVGRAPAKREPGSMGFLEHLDEFRQTVVRCLTVFLIALVAVAVSLEEVMAYLQQPFTDAAAGNPAVRLVTTTPLGVFTVMFQIVFLSSFLLSLPFLLYFIGQFVAPALVEREKRLLRPVSLGALALFLLGVTFAYFVIVPSTIRFSILLNTSFGFEMVWAADRYYSMLMWLVLSLGAAFQFPLVMLLLVKLGLLSAAKLASWRRIAAVAMLVFAAIITPTPDPFTQLLVAVPLYGLYEISIFLALWIERRERLSEA